MRPTASSTTTAATVVTMGPAWVFDHRGHRAEIVTRYEITVDGQPRDQHIEVLDERQRRTTGSPVLVPSAVDMVRAVIDSSYEAPEEIRAGCGRPERET